MILLLGCTLSRNDLDGDGWDSPLDCDDHNHLAHPGAREDWYDGIDEDCDGADDFDADGDGVAVDEDCDDADPSTGGPDQLYRDADEDGYGTDAQTAEACTDAGYLAIGGDCDDADPAINPDAVELCSDGVDQNCNQSADGCDLVGEFSADDERAVAIEPGDGDWPVSLAFVADLGGAGVTGFAAGTGASAVSDESPGTTWYFWGDLLAGSWTQASFSPDDPGGYAGHSASAWAVGRLPDLDGDGAAEVLVGGRYGADGAGAVWIIPGGREGALDDGDVLAAFIGGGTDELGSAVATADFDRDGAAEVVVGAPGWATDACGDRPEGLVALFRGPPSGEAALSEAWASFSGEVCGDAVGTAVATADVDGDGVGDLVIGSSNHDRDGDWGDGNDAGAGYVVLGGALASGSLADADGRVQGEESDDGHSDNLGLTAAGIGDFDGDGREDLALGAVGADLGEEALTGAVYVFVGSTGGALPDYAEDAFEIIYGEGAGNQLGRSLAGGADVNGDGLDDLLAGAPYAADDDASFTGRASLVLGNPTGGVFTVGESDGRFHGADALDELGSAVGLGDLDADGWADVLLGANRQADGWLDDPGRVYLFAGGGM